MKTVHIFTDGSCRGNPGPGGWALLLRYVDAQGRGHERVGSGAVPLTTNNRMELEAVIQSLAVLREPCQVELYTDSHYVITLLTGGRARTNHDCVARLLACRLAPPPHPTLRSAGMPGILTTSVSTRWLNRPPSPGERGERGGRLTRHRAITWVVAIPQR